MRFLIFLLFPFLFLVQTPLKAQQWGYKMDTVYYNSFDKETEDFRADTLYNQSSLNAKQSIKNGVFILHNSVNSKEILNVPLINKEELSTVVQLNFNHKKSIGSFFNLGDYNFIFEEKGIRVRMIVTQTLEPAITYFQYPQSKDSTSLIFDVTNKGILLFHFNNQIAVFPWQGGLIAQSVTVSPGKSFYLNKLAFKNSTSNKTIYNFDKENARWSSTELKSGKIAAIRTFKDGKYIITTPSAGKYGGFRLDDFYSAVIAIGQNSELLLSGPFLGHSNVDIVLAGQKFSIRNNTIKFNNGSPQPYDVPRDLVGAIFKVEFVKNKIIVRLGGFTKEFSRQYSNFSITLHLVPDSEVAINELTQVNRVPKTFADFINDEATKKVEKWMVKDDYTKTSDYNIRVSQENIQKKKAYFEQVIINEYGAKKIDCSSIVSDYDADNDRFTLQLKGLNTAYLSMPTSAAKLVDNKFCDYKIEDALFTYANNSFHLISAAVIVNNQRYYISDNPNAAPMVASRSGSDVSSTAYVSKTFSGALKDKQYYLLVIANETYPDPDVISLNNPIKESESLINTLTSLYNFRSENVTFLKNATRAEMMGAFDKLSREITPDDNLLIYYAGHGYWDEKMKSGYWLPVDASKDIRVNWFSNSSLREYIGGIITKHTLLISDACFSGSIFKKNRDAFTTSNLGMAELYKRNSRQAITSGSLDQTVPDISVFSKYLLKTLQENQEEMITAQQLFNSFRPAVINNSTSSQVPQFGDIRETGDEGGEFIFIKK